MQDHNGFVWFGTRDGLNRFDGCHFRVFRNRPDDDTSLGNNFVRALYEKSDHFILVGTDNGLFKYNPDEGIFSYVNLPGTENDMQVAINAITADREGRIWIGTFGQGVYVYDNGKWSNYRATGKAGDLKSDRVWKIFLDSYGTIWVGTLGGGLNRYDASRRSFKCFNFDTSGIDNDIYEIYEDSSHRFWIGTWGWGLLCMNRRDETFTTEVSQDVCEAIRSVHETAPGVFLLGGNSGLFQYNSVTGECREISLSGANTPLQVNDAVYSILSDREGGLWVGGYFAGLNYTHGNVRNFTHYRLADLRSDPTGSVAGKMIEDGKRNLWVATENRGLVCFDRYNRSMKFISEPQLSHNNLHALMLEGDNLWVGNLRGTIDIVNTATSKVEKTMNHADGLDVGPIYAIFRTHSNDIYVGGIFGLLKYDRSTRRFVRETKFPHTAFVYDIIEDNEGLMWVATYGNGIFTFDAHSGKWYCYQHNPADETTLKSNKVISLCMDDRGLIWIGTEGGGLSRFNRGDGTFISYVEKDGLPNNVIYGIVPDRSGALWMSSNAGLSCFYPDNDSICDYKYSDGLLGSQFNYKSSIRLGDGSLCFGGIDGINIFNPGRIDRNAYVPPVMITGYDCIRHDGTHDENFVNGENGCAKLDFYDVASVSFDFVALSYTDPSKNMYAFRLKGVDHDWVYTDDSHSAIYRNLPSGKYTFEVKGSNSDGVWNPDVTSIDFVIHPPIYRSNMAYVIYILLGVSLIYWAYTGVRTRHERRRMLAQMKYENEKQHEYHETQLSFFTNIAHEIRTPLSLINAPLEDIKDMYPNNKDFKEAVDVMRDNTSRLMTLVNQLLDFRQLPHMSPLKFSAVDINTLIDAISSRFGLLARRRGVVISKHLPSEHIIAYTDSDAITKILSNLMFNAVKYTRDSIAISGEVLDDGRRFVIKVADNGKGIPAGQKEKIFTPFYTTATVENLPISGTGLGLAIVSRLVELLKGTVEVSDNDPAGCVFTIELPLGDSAMIARDNVSNSEVYEETSSDDTTPAGESAILSAMSEVEKPAGALKTILVVEDNAELRDFLVKKLRTEYNVMSAENGKVALGVLENHDVDLVITDVLMPEMDGIQLCEAIRSQSRWDNVSIIILTAVSDEGIHVKGLDVGADAYLAKPFSVGLLRTQIQNILASRARIRQEYMEKSWLPYKESKDTQVDESFVKEVDRIIEAHLTDSEFNIDVLATEMNMSRSGLHRKMRSEMSTTPNDYVRLFRLKKAAKLLATGQYQVSAVGYMVGFNTPSYFSKSFLAQFGVSPKDFLSKVVDKDGSKTKSGNSSETDSK
ncbi:MAG: response regulator [Duncaniella sp.]|nr:response regulator [Duncaniella sp.]